jgi:GBP family porin
MQLNKLTAALVASMAVSTAAYAQSGSSVTLYGILDGGLRYNKVSVDNGSGASNFGLAYGQQSGNRFGLRGVEDIGGGNRVTFQLESGFDLGNGTLGQSGRMFGRQAWVGVENNTWGYVRVGRQTNFATEYVGIPVDPFATGFGQLNMGTAFGVVNTDRISNAIKYQTPNMSGFQAGIGYSFATGSSAFYSPGANGNDQVGVSGTGYNFATNDNTRQLTLGAKYANGPVYVAASYDKLYADQGGTGRDASISSWNLAGTYDFKVVKVAAGYGQTRDGAVLGQGTGVTGASSITTRLGGSGDLIFAPAVGTNSYIIGATVPVNPVSRVMVSWNMLTPNTNMKDIYNAQNQTSYNLAYTYDFTKRTNVYALLGYMDNVGTVDTVKSTLVGVGLRHQF